MRLAVVILIMLGILAAGAAAILVKMLQNPDKKVKTVQVVLAAEDLPARTKLDKSNVKLASVPKQGLPVGFYTDPAQAIGKTVKIAVVEGQPIHDGLLMARDDVATLLRPGMLAFQAPLSRRNTAVDLLKPGYIVDVFATFPLNNSSKGDAVVTPLLQQIRILGIDDRTLLEQEVPPGGQQSSYARGNVTVTLEVTARQAAALQLALERGTLGLAIRNATDETWNPMEPMVVKEGQLTAASETLDPQTLAWVSQFRQLLAGKPLTGDPNTPATADAGAVDPNNPNPVAVGAPAAAVPGPPPGMEIGMGVAPKPTPAWNVTIIRRDKIEEKEIEVKKDEEEAVAQGGG